MQVIFRNVGREIPYKKRDRPSFGCFPWALGEATGTTGDCDIENKRSLNEDGASGNGVTGLHIGLCFFAVFSIPLLQITSFSSFFYSYQSFFVEGEIGRFESGKTKGMKTMQMTELSKKYWSYGEPITCGYIWFRADTISFLLVISGVNTGSNMEKSFPSTISHLKLLLLLADGS